MMHQALLRWCLTQEGKPKIDIRAGRLVERGEGFVVAPCLWHVIWPYWQQHFSDSKGMTVATPPWTAECWITSGEHYEGARCLGGQVL